jgi:murein DD-endopeptidase MepM/ murein hydrolase activator NlpD
MVHGDPRTVGLSAPVPQGNAACGLVDTFDFPLDPPDAGPTVSGGRDFGVYRSRYNGLHTGEDWRLASRSASLGAPVYSIAHGTVTYAAPLGWGVDQGVVIVRHVLPDGSTVLSMYGHLDPPSVVLTPGSCVERGEMVGKIGKPRTSPHLHFEIRTHMPNQPGPGYWSVDPTLAGWKPPSQFIWSYRLANSPGVRWTRPPDAQTSLGLGLAASNVLAVVEEDELVGIDARDGAVRWRTPITISVVAGTVNVNRSIIYLGDRFGRVEAYAVSALNNPSTTDLRPAWTIKLDAFGVEQMMPLPGGGLVVSTRRGLFGVSPAGEQLWQTETEARPSEWTLTPTHLIVSGMGDDGPLWMINDSGPTVWTAHVSGRPLGLQDQVWLYASDGVYRLNVGTPGVEPLYLLPYGALGYGDALALPDGGALVAHTDRFDRRLILLDRDGELRWERSFSTITRGALQLLMVDGAVYMVTQVSSGSSNTVSVYAVDLEDAELVRIFTGGSRTARSGSAWAFAMDAVGGADEAGGLLINIGDGNLVALNPLTALDAILQAAHAP